MTTPPRVGLIDTHAHLDDKRFADDLPTVLERAWQGAPWPLEAVIAVATTAESTDRVAALAAHFPGRIFPTAGIHPNHVTEAAPGDWDRVLAATRRGGYVALGETGLDRHWDFTPFPLQQDFFARHLGLMRETGLPVVIHCREAEADLIPMLRAEYDRGGPLRGILHSFCGDAAAAAAYVAMGLHISFAGMLTSKDADALRQVAAGVPAERLLVETDSPYLTPVPLRGKVKRNEPAHVAHTAACLAKVRGVAVEELATLTTANARALLNLPAALK